MPVLPKQRAGTRSTVAAPSYAVPQEPKARTEHVDVMLIDKCTFGGIL